MSSVARARVVLKANLGEKMDGLCQVFDWQVEPDVVRHEVTHISL